MWLLQGQGDQKYIGIYWGVDFATVARFKDHDRYGRDRYEHDRYERDRYEHERYERERYEQERYERDRYEHDRYDYDSHYEGRNGHQQYDGRYGHERHGHDRWGDRYGMNEQYKQKLPDYIDPRRTRAIFVICIKQHVVPSRELTHPTWEKENHRLKKVPAGSGYLFVSFQGGCRGWIWYEIFLHCRLGDGLKHFLFSSLLGEHFQFD